jgi:RNA polymerase sigma factor (sigma-70 family)
MKYKNIKSDVSVHDLRNRFLVGDDEAYAMIYRLYAKDLYSLGLSFHVKTELIEDAIQDVFVEIYANKKILVNVNNLKLYILRSFRNRLFYLVKKTSDINIEDIIYKEQEYDYQEQWIEKEEEEEKYLFVQSILSELNANQREAIHHRFIEGLSCEEVATVMNINYQSAKNLIHRAIKRLRLLTACLLSVVVIIIYIWIENI